MIFTPGGFFNYIILNVIMKTPYDIITPFPNFSKTHSPQPAKNMHDNLHSYIKIIQYNAQNPMYINETTN